MKTSESIGKIAAALLKAQTEMGGAKKGAANPYFKSRYADLGAVLEACKELLNQNEITILQPHSTCAHTGKKFVETVLVHSSGEFISGQTEIVCSKENDPQAQGSAITYARRYGLQSLLSMPAEDDDGESAMNRRSLRQSGGVDEKPRSGKANNGGAKAKATGNAPSPKASSRPTSLEEESQASGGAEAATLSRAEVNAKITALAGVVKGAGTLSFEEIRAEMKKRFGVDSKEKMSDEQAREFHDFLVSKTPHQ